MLSRLAEGRRRRVDEEHLDGCLADVEFPPATAAELETLLRPPLRTRARFTASAAAATLTGGRDLSLARRLKRELGEDKVVVVPGWRSRGAATLNPKGIVRHHTAGSRSGLTPSLPIVVNGRSDLTGPLANIYVGRDRKVYVVASGKANHVGLFDRALHGMVGNSDCLGDEVEHVGTEPMENDMHRLVVAAHAALSRGRWGADQNIDHKEAAPSRKVDLATAPIPAAHRLDVAKLLSPARRYRFELTALNQAKTERVTLDKSRTRQAGDGRVQAQKAKFIARVAGRYMKLKYLKRRDPHIERVRVED